MAVAMAETAAISMRATVIVAALSASLMAPRAGWAQQTPARMSAIEVLQDALFVNANAPGDWYALGRALYAENRDRESIAAFERAMQFGSARAHDAPWCIALAYARLGNRRQAFRWAENSIATGVSNTHQMEVAPEFSAYRRDPMFTQLMEASHSSKTRDDRMPISRVDMWAEK
jgi:hypothetical protein